MEEELTEEVEMAKRRIDEINMELNQVLNKHTLIYINDIVFWLLCMLLVPPAFDKCKCQLCITHPVIVGVFAVGDGAAGRCQN